MLRHVPNQAMNTIKKYVRGVPAAIPSFFPPSNKPAVQNPEYFPAYNRHTSVFPAPANTLPAFPPTHRTLGELVPYSPNAGALVPYNVLSQAPMLQPSFHTSDLPSLPSSFGERLCNDLAFSKSLISPESLLMPARAKINDGQPKPGEQYTDQRQWIRSLKKEEIKAIRIYTGDGYMAINQFLRGQIDKLPDDLPPDIIENINKAIDKMYIPEPITVFRGTNIFEDINKYFTYNTNKELKSVAGLIGQTIIEKAFLSTSINEHSSFNYLKTHWTIEVPAGSHGGLISPISAVPDESEMLFSTNKQLLIVDAKIDGNFINIHARML